MVPAGSLPSIKSTGDRRAPPLRISNGATPSDLIPTSSAIGSPLTPFESNNHRSLIRAETEIHHGEADIHQSESSRFSLDSINNDDLNKSAKPSGSTIGTKSVKTMKNLWRKSTGKKTPSLQVNQSGGPFTQQLSPHSPLTPPLPNKRDQSSSQSSSRSTTPLNTSFAPNGFHKPNDLSAVNHFHFDQEAQFQSRPGSKTIQSRPSISETNIVINGSDKNGTRRSVLKMFKNPSAANLGPESRPSLDRGNADQPRVRRPSEAGLMVSKKSEGNNDMPPPSPRVPPQFSLSTWGKKQVSHSPTDLAADTTNFSNTSMVDVSGGYTKSLNSAESGDEISDSDFEILSSQPQKQANLYR